ncbi:hypothetical protein H9L39_07230 [Fusarium oxysporum f. sp. albedinis]|nr:hypothetical protein H9L39_07230 [Fusarium oxysporum f. sp. albedinis]
MSLDSPILDRRLEHWQVRHQDPFKYNFATAVTRRLLSDIHSGNCCIFTIGLATMLTHAAPLHSPKSFLS